MQQNRWYMQLIAISTLSSCIISYVWPLDHFRCRPDSLTEHSLSDNKRHTSISFDCFERQLKTFLFPK